LRLYRLWLSVALTFPGSVLDITGLKDIVCPRLFANFWILRCLLKESVKSRDKFVLKLQERMEETVSLLQIVDYGKQLSEKDFIDIVIREKPKDIKAFGDSVLSIASLGKDSNEPIPSVELDDISWIRAIESFSTEDLQNFARRLCVAHRVFRLSGKDRQAGAYPQSLGKCLLRMPPMTGYCIIERAIACMLHDSQDLRDILLYRDDLWGPRTKKTKDYDTVQSEEPV
jgi:hypothetical protein